ncbi:hypothetical protein H0H93_016215 [Arthromyces matolae]|nr:hypothetical protein H0H93_016215 [Arthromyces matolae]
MDNHHHQLINCFNRLSNLHPFDVDDVLHHVQTANSSFVNAYAAGHRSHLLAQQSIATAQESGAAAQECLNACENAKKSWNDALISLRKLQSARTGLNGGGGTERSIHHLQLQDDLHMLGQWLSEKESEDAAQRVQVVVAKDKVQAILSTIPASGPFDIDAIATQVANCVVEKSQAVTNVTGTPSAFAPQNSNRPSPSQVETAKTKEQQSHPPLPIELDGDFSSHDQHQFYVKTTERVKPLNQINRCQIQNQDERISTDAASQYNAQRPLPPSLKKNSDAAGSQIIVQQERVITGELSGVASPSILPGMPGQGKVAKRSPSKGSDRVTVAKRVDKQESISEQRRDEELRLLEERKRSEVMALKKKKEEERNDVLRKEAEEEATNRERELLAAQQRRRQEVMLQKQRATAETAARINAERARKKEQEQVTETSTDPPIPLASAANTDLDPPANEPVNAVSGKAAKRIRKRPKSLTGGAKLGTLDIPPPILASSIEAHPSTLITRLTNVDTLAQPTGGHAQDGNENMIIPGISAPTSVPNQALDIHDNRHRRGDDFDSVIVPPLSSTFSGSYPHSLPFIPSDLAKSTPLSYNISPVPVFHGHQSAADKKSHVVVKKESPIPSPLILQMVGQKPKLSQSANTLPSLPSSLPEKPVTATAMNPLGKKEVAKQRSQTSTSLLETHKKSVVVNPPPSKSSAALITKATVSPPNPHRDGVIFSPRTSSNTMVSATAIDTRTSSTSGGVSHLFDDGSQISPAIHLDGGWDRPIDDDRDPENFRMRDPSRSHLRPPQRSRRPRRNNDHYSPPPPDRGYSRRSPSLSAPLSPSPYSPVLGKRRHHENAGEQEPPARRQRPTDALIRTRSPDVSTRWWPVPLDPQPFQTLVQSVDPFDTSQRPGLEHAWSFHSPDRSPLQARMEDIQSHATFTDSKHDRQNHNHRVRPTDDYASDHRDHQEFYARGHANTRAPSRGRDRQGNRPLNLEDRISSSSNKPLTLMNRLQPE